ncbi:Tn3 family transposase [Yinghuangia aomiensis]
MSSLGAGGLQGCGRLLEIETGPFRFRFEAGRPRFLKAGPLRPRRADLDLLRLGASLKFGHATASLMVGKLCTASRQNVLAAALKEYGALRRTIFAARYLSDEAYRRKITRQLSKGESLHALRRRLHYADLGKVRARHREQQNEQAWCLDRRHQRRGRLAHGVLGAGAVAQLRRAGRVINDEVLAHVSPARSESVNFFGTIAVDYDRELAQLDGTGHRPLRGGLAPAV